MCIVYSVFTAETLDSTNVPYHKLKSEIAVKVINRKMYKRRRKTQCTWGGSLVYTHTVRVWKRMD